MKTGIFTWFGFILSFEEKMRLLKEYGFESTCLWFGNEFAEIDGDYLTQNERAQRFGIAAESAHIPYYGANSLWFDTLDGESYFQKCMDNLAQAQSCGVDTLVIHPFERDAPGVADGLCRERFHRLGDEADKRGVFLAVENLADNAALRRILEDVKNPHVGLCFDSGHNNVAAGKDFSLLRDFAHRVFALHLHDNNGEKDEHLLPGEGNLDWGAFLAALKDTGYNRSFMLESCYPYDFDADADDGTSPVRQPADMTPEQYLQTAQEACRRAMAKGEKG